MDTNLSPEALELLDAIDAQVRAKITQDLTE